MHNIVTEGYMPFMGYHTYYRIVGEASEKVAQKRSEAYK